MELEGAEAQVKQARAAREQIESGCRRWCSGGEAERALSERAERHDALAKRVYEARSARERLGLREEQAGASAQALARRIERVELELSALSDSGTEGPAAAQAGEAGPDGARARATERIEALEDELAEIEQQREREIEREIEGLETAREREAARVGELEEELEQARAARAKADELAEQARERLQGGRARGAGYAPRGRAGGWRAGGGEPVPAQPRERRGWSATPWPAKALSEELSVRDGYELALAAALGGRLSAVLVRDVAGAEALLDRAGPDGGSALLADLGSGTRRGFPGWAGEGGAAGVRRGALLDLVSGPAEVSSWHGGCSRTRGWSSAWRISRLASTASP